MSLGGNLWMLGAGLVLIVLGILCRRWASRNSLMDKTTGAVWDAVKARDTGAVRQHIEGTLSEIANEAGTVGKARKAAGMAVREAAARTFSLIGALALAAGLILVALAFAWA